MNKINDRWAKLILWAGSYVSVFLFAIVGGYYWLYTDRNELKKECKKVLCVTLIFLALDMIIALISYFITIFNLNGFAFVTVVESIIAFAKILVFAIFGLFSLFGIKVTVHKKQDESEAQVVEAKEAELKTEVKNVELDKEE